MSENLNRSTPDFSKYDSMSIGELEEILRADAQGPERDDSDVDEILYVMEVLAKKRRENGTAGKTAFEAYQEFQQHYLPMVEEESKPKRKSNIIPFRRIATVAACLVLAFSLATSAYAFSFRNVWDAVVTWAQETFCFSTGVEVSAPAEKSSLEFESLQELLDKYGISVNLVPTWKPDGYTLAEILYDESPIQDTFLAIYSDGERRLKISVQSYVSGAPEQIERSNDLVDTYVSSGIEYYLFSNYDQVRAVWIIDSYEVYISGKITIDELIMMIDSIGKG